MARTATAALTSSDSSSIHDRILPMNCLHFPETPPASSRAARHREGVSGQAAPIPRPDDLSQVPRHKGDYPNAIGGNHRVKGPGNGAAHQRSYFQFRQMQRFLHRKLSMQILLCFGNDPAGLDPDQQNLPGVVEDRRDSILPAGKRCVHAKPRTTFIHQQCILRTNMIPEAGISITVCNK